MRYVTSSLRVLALLPAVMVFGACGGGEPAETVDSAAMAAAAAAAAPTPDSFTLMSSDGSWSGDISPANIVFRQKKGAKMDSLVFDFREPKLSGAISDYESLLTAKDTVRISITLAMSACTDKAGTQYTHIAQIWLSGDVELQSKGCASRK